MTSDTDVMDANIRVATVSSAFLRSRQDHAFTRYVLAIVFICGGIYIQLTDYSIMSWVWILCGLINLGMAIRMSYYNHKYKAQLDELWAVIRQYWTKKDATR